MTARPPHLGAISPTFRWPVTWEHVHRALCSRTTAHHSPSPPSLSLSLFFLFPLVFSFSHLIIIIIIISSFPFFLFFFFSSSSSFIPSNIFQQSPPPSSLLLLSLFLFFLFFLKKLFSSLFLLSSHFPSSPPSSSLFNIPAASHHLPRGPLPFSSSLVSIYILPRTSFIRIIPVRLWLDFPRCYRLLL